MLFVGVAPHMHVGEGSNVRSETKIFDLETHEFGNNPPFKLNVPRRVTIEKKFLATF
jgi:hypothetical protein